MKPNKVDAQVGKRMEKVILWAVAADGPIVGENHTYAAIAANLFREWYGEKLADSSILTETMSGLLMGMVGDGLLYSVELPIGFTSRGLTVRGWERLYQLEHPVHYWLGRHGWSAAIAGAAVLTSVTATVTLIITLVSS